MSVTTEGARVQPRYDLADSFSVEVIIEPEDHRAEPVQLAATLLNLSASGAKLAVPTALVAWKKAFLWQPGPGPRSQHRVTAGLFTPGRSAATDNS